MLRRLLVLGLLAGTVHAQSADYGETEFENSGAAEAQAPFLRGVLMLHSFEYEDAREAFQEARRIDPDFALAAWGEAMTHNHPIWQQQDRDAARTTLDVLAQTPEGRLAKAPTEREKDYLRTLEVLYGEGGKEERDFAYAEALGDLSAAYPDDLDAAAFYALSILGTAHNGRDFATYMQAAAVAEQVFDANPQHPGAAHYLIHAYDDPVHAPLGLRPALVYDEIAPAASHALHMPSHIYFALGMWDEGAEMNVRSFEAAKARTDARGEPLNGHGWHALGWRLYAELQRGRFDEAERLLTLADELAAGSERRRYAPALMRAHFLANTERWDQTEGWQSTDVDDLSSSAAAQVLFALGWASLERGDPDAATSALTALQIRLDENEEEPSEAEAITALALEALIVLDEGDHDVALDLLRDAVAIEEARPLDFGPPIPVKPIHELIGEVLLELGEPEEAWGQFEATLARYPRRSRALLGLARATTEAGDEAAAHAAYADLARSWHEADTALPALAEVNERAKAHAQ